MVNMLQIVGANSTTSRKDGTTPFSFRMYSQEFREGCYCFFFQTWKTNCLISHPTVSFCISLLLSKIFTIDFTHRTCSILMTSQDLIHLDENQNHWHVVILRHLNESKTIFSNCFRLSIFQTSAAFFIPLCRLVYANRFLCHLLQQIYMTSYFLT